MAMPSSRTKTSSSPSVIYSHPLTCSYRLWLSTSTLSLPSSSSSPSVNKQPSSPMKKQKNNDINNNNYNAVVMSSLSYKKKRSCMCSPTMHAGSFRCAHHKSIAEQDETASCWGSNGSSRLNLRRSAMMKNSVVRIGGAEVGDDDEFVRKTLISVLNVCCEELMWMSLHPHCSQFYVRKCLL